VVFPTNLTGVTGGQASVIAYNQLYAGSGAPFCGVVNPAVDWSYNTNFDTVGTATTGTVQTSPVLSADGNELAFVETRSAANGGAILHLLKWNAGDGAAITSAIAPTIATVWTADGLPGHCPVAGSCMISIVLHGSQPDTGASPFYDYQRDVVDNQANTTLFPQASSLYFSSQGNSTIGVRCGTSSGLWNQTDPGGAQLRPLEIVANK
jgi:hypothetical protein